MRLHILRHYLVLALATHSSKSNKQADLLLQSWQNSAISWYAFTQTRVHWGQAERPGPMLARHTFTHAHSVHFTKTCTFFCHVRPKYHIQVHLSSTLLRIGQSNPFKQSKYFTNIIRDRNLLFKARIYYLRRNHYSFEKSLFTRKSLFISKNHFSQ